MKRTPLFRPGQRVMVAWPDDLSVRRGWVTGRCGTVRSVDQGFRYRLEEAYMGGEEARDYMLFHEEELEALP